jgi:hypothetical protein
MATAASSRRPARWAAAAASVGLGATLAVALLATHRSPPPRSSGSSAVPVSARELGAFARLASRPAPGGWNSAAIPASGATLHYPPGWKPIPGDIGTVSVALRGARGLYEGYLNLTPREGVEQLAGWAAFRTARNRGEGDRNVRTVASAEGLRFADSRGSCVIDDYISRVGSHPYRELACVLAGHRFTNVFVGATIRSDWPALGPVIERAASSVVER